MLHSRQRISESEDAGSGERRPIWAGSVSTAAARAALSWLDLDGGRIEILLACGSSSVANVNGAAAGTAFGCPSDPSRGHVDTERGRQPALPSFACRSQRHAPIL